MYDFLENYHQRMEQVAIHHFLNIQAGTREELRIEGLARGHALNLIMQSLCFIMEKSLREEVCEVKDLGAFLSRIISVQHFGEIAYEEVNTEELADYFIKGLFQNRGKPYYFETYNFRDNKPVNVMVRLIEDYPVMVDGKEVFAYRLTSQGYAFLFGTLEVEEAMQVSFEQLRLQYAIKKRNFGSAKESVDNLFNLNRKQIQKLREYIRGIKEDISGFTIEAYEQTYQGTFDTLQEQKDKHEELYRLIEHTREQYMQEFDGKEDLSILDELSKIDYIRSRLHQLLGEQVKLFMQQQTLSQVYQEAIDNVLFIGFENRMNLERDILERMEESPESLYGMAAFLRPLMLPDFDKIFNLNQAYSSQKIELEEELATNREMYLNSEVDGEEQAAHLQHLIEIQGHYRAMVKKILDGLISSDQGRCHLGIFLDEPVASVELLRTMLIQLNNDRRVEFQVMIEQLKSQVWTLSEAFHMGYTLSELMGENPAYGKIKGLLIARTAGKEMVVIGEAESDRTLRCPLMIFERIGGDGE